MEEKKKTHKHSICEFPTMGSRKSSTSSTDGNDALGQTARGREMWMGDKNRKQKRERPDTVQRVIHHMIWHRKSEQKTNGGNKRKKSGSGEQEDVVG